MNPENKLQDWYLRYGFILDRRFTDKQKEKFIRSLITDITSIRTDLKTDQFRSSEKGEENTNIYVGDVEKADQIICTYFDTPSLHLGGYHFFDKSLNQRNTLAVNFILSVIWLILGILLTLYVAMPLFNTYSLINIRTFFLIVVFILYFILLNKFSRGIAKRKNLVRNSSSVLSILDFMETHRNRKKNKIAYAFLDSGVTNDKGLDRLKDISKGKILFLDSIGSKNELYLIGSTEKILKQYPNSDLIQKIQAEEFEEERVSYLISAQWADKFYLEKKEIQSTHLNTKNIAMISAYLKEVFTR